MFDTMTHVLARLAPEMSRKHNLVGFHGVNAVESFLMEEPRKIPSRRNPPSLVEMLNESCDLLRDLKLHGIAGDLEQLAEALKGILALTKHGDALFGDEIRNFLQMRHHIKSRRGTDLDPMLGLRHNFRDQIK
tara:strand:- start:1960 stop:2358 length:399 start_codon:yes stop_codon:yes gene_type:complete